MKKLSVIVINKNREFSLDWCIRRIIPQLAENDEFIIIDDDSDDRSPEIIEKYAHNFTSIIRFSSGGNRSKVRNRAAAEATGDVLVFIDGDVIICPKALDIVRERHEDDTVVGLNGAVYGNSHTVEQLEMITHYPIERFNAEVEKDFAFLEGFRDICDYRTIWPDSVLDENRNWCNYFTSFATAARTAFDKIGGFEEGFTKWGVEDMEFAYRLNREGRIVFDSRIISYHHPHAKNAFGNALSNLENLYTMLDKYRTLEMELVCSVSVQVDLGFINEVTRMFDYMAQHNTCSERIELKEKEIALYFPSKEHEKGYVEYVQNGEKKSLELFGFALPFANGTFDTVYFCGAYSLMQSSFLAMTIQEALRIGGKVLLSKTICDTPSYFEKMFLAGYTFLFGDVSGIVHSMVWFDRFEYDEKYYEMKWKDGSAVYLNKQIHSI